ncbi:MAG TPA: hypothetical protein VM681_00085 [Candidatus Thermoplasmatota archaeon]|nr:hypothetical protein [Candidatus Thermoplasmatota archaeon]
MIPNPAQRIEVELSIRRSPKSVRAWWTELPDDYTAKDPEERPFRIRTLARWHDGSELEAHWRRPDGSVVLAREILRVLPDGRWTFEGLDARGYNIFDEFAAYPANGGDETLLRIVQILTAREPGAEEHFAAQFRTSRDVWRGAVPICERDAP